MKCPKCGKDAVLDVQEHSTAYWWCGSCVYGFDGSEIIAKEIRDAATLLSATLLSIAMLDSNEQGSTKSAFDVLKILKGRGVDEL